MCFFWAYLWRSICTGLPVEWRRPCSIPMCSTALSVKSNRILMTRKGARTWRRRECWLLSRKCSATPTPSGRPGRDQEILCPVTLSRGSLLTTNRKLGAWHVEQVVGAECSGCEAPPTSRIAPNRKIAVFTPSTLLFAMDRKSLVLGGPRSPLGLLP